MFRLAPTIDPYHLYAERGSPKYERAAMRWLSRYLEEGDPSLVRFARLTSGLAKRVEDPDEAGGRIRP